MHKFFTALALALLLAFSAPVLAASPEETLRSAMDEMLKVLQTSAAKGTPEYQQERAQLEKIIRSIFDFEELSARAVGLHWKRFTQEQKKDFSQAFADLLGAKYLDRIQAYNNEQIIIGDMRTSARGNVEIASEVVQQDKRIPIAYRMTETPQGWRVYDVIVEGVSLVKNYRTQFMEIMVNGKPEDLIKAVREKASSTQSRSSRHFYDIPQGGRAVCMLYHIVN